MNAKQRYEQVDWPFYRKEIAPMLPPKVLDFHTHIWSSKNWKEIPWKTGAKSGQYMVKVPEYPPAALLADGKRTFPDREYHAVCFGYPVPVADWEKDTAYLAAAARRHPNLYPLILSGPDLGISRERYERALDEGGFFGFKVFLNWFGDNYGDKRVEEIFGPLERELANERRLVVMLHVPRSGRLADPVVQKGVRWLARECPEASIVLAHGGRCYVPTEMKVAIGCMRNLLNVSFDISMVMDPICLQLALEVVGPQRMLYATDFPVAAMRGRRVQVKDHWVDVVLAGYPQSAFRVAGDIHATFMSIEIALAMRWAADLAGLKRAEIRGIFWDYGMRLLRRVRRSKLLER